MILPLDTVIKTSRCYLIIIKKEDIPFVFSATRYKGFNDGMLWNAPKNEAELIESYERGLISWHSGSSYSFSICKSGNNKLLGRICIIKNTDNIWMIGFWLHPKHQGKGYMTESVKAILELGFDTLKASKIEACYAVWNKQSEKVLRSVGMQFIEHIPQGFIKKGEWVAENKLGITDRDWCKHKSSDWLDRNTEKKT